MTNAQTILPAPKYVLPIAPPKDVPAPRAEFGRTATQDYTLLAPSRISTEGFPVLLQNAPAGVKANLQEMFSLLLAMEIDPAYALAQATEEHSAAWTGVAGVTKSFGNSRMNSQWYGKAYDRSTGKVYATRAEWMRRVPSTARDGFKLYDDYVAALFDWACLTRQYALEWKNDAGQLLNTVGRMAPVYAPDSDGNDSAAYAAGMNARIEQWASDLRPYTLTALGGYVKVLQPVNRRSGPGAKYTRLNAEGQFLQPSTYAIEGLTMNGTPYTEGGQTSPLWFKLPDGRGWITGHTAYSVRV